MPSLDGRAHAPHDPPPAAASGDQDQPFPGAMVPGFRSFDEGLRHDECETSADWKSGGGPCSRHNPASGQREACGRTRVRRCASPLHTPLGRPAPANRSAHESGPTRSATLKQSALSQSQARRRLPCCLTEYALSLGEAVASKQHFVDPLPPNCDGKVSLRVMEATPTTPEFVGGSSAFLIAMC
jgi:hypothetical protein